MEARRQNAAVDDLQKLRTVRFAEAKRGYDPQEVDDFLSELVEWLEPQLHQQRQSTGEKVASAVEEIFLAAERSAAEIRQNAEDEGKALLAKIRGQADEARRQAEAAARELADEARREAAEVRAAATARADEAIAAAKADAERRRDEAARTARAHLERANAEAREIIGDAEEDRRELDSLVSALERRRRAVYSGLDKLRRALNELPGEID